MVRKDKVVKLSVQMKNRGKKQPSNQYDGNFSSLVSTGSTLLDLAISGERVRGGGLPFGVFVEIFGPSSCGKTVLLCEIAGAVQRQGGAVMFHDPEARLNKQFAKMFGLNIAEKDYYQPDTVTDVFSKVRAWKTDTPKLKAVFADSLAALSTDMEMENKDGDKMGMRRAKEFSEQLRKTCRIITKENLLMVCSNQVRVNTDGYGEKYTTPGGVALGFYASLRLRAKPGEKIKKTVSIAGKEVVRVIGIKTDIEVYKSSISKPYHTAPLVILFDYGIDDIRTNLQYIKDYTKNTLYTVDDAKLDVSLEKSIKMVERENKEQALREQVIDLWEQINTKFDSNRKNKRQ